MKHEWRKQEKELYLPKNQPQIVSVPPMNYFTLQGWGNPNSEQFAEEVGILYSLAYAVKMLPKKGITPQGYFEYTVYPLEGIWDLAEEAKGKNILDKDKLVYTIMIRQPDFITDKIARTVIEDIKSKKPHHLYDGVKFEHICEGMCVQMMHLGPYDNEPASFAIMEEYCKANDQKRKSQTHKEIYLTDARKTAPEKLQTVLRIPVEDIN